MLKNDEIVFRNWLLRIITNFTVMKSNLHDEDNHIYIQVLINLNGMAPKPQVQNNCLNRLDSVLNKRCVLG